jgi:tRNA-splicing ligase RtcB
VRSDEGRRYLAAMAAAANFAFANRQMMTHYARQAFEQVLREGPAALGMTLVYDVAHNIAKIERHEVNGKERKVVVHRKGATRALPAGHPLVPEVYRHVGQPVLVPGDMGRCSYVLVGMPGALEESFGSCAHGAGRRLSRKGGIRATKGRHIAQELESAGILVRAAGHDTLREEFPEAYKDVSLVVDVVHAAGLARKVARLRPLGVVKG